MTQLTPALTPAQATVIAALLSMATTLLVCLLNNRAQRKKFADEIRERDIAREKAEAVRDAELKMWMKGVDEKLDIHNGYADKLATIQQDIAVIKNTLYKQA